MVKELFKIRRIISINRDASKNISEEDNGFANDFENFARYTRRFNDDSLTSHFACKVSYELKSIYKMLSKEYPMVRYMGNALEGSGNYANAMNNLVEYMELVNSTKK